MYVQKKTTAKKARGEKEKKKDPLACFARTDGTHTVVLLAGNYLTRHMRVQFIQHVLLVTLEGWPEEKEKKFRGSTCPLIAETRAKFSS
jgi:hypothetical protein